ncbi:MAG TPA: GxxExxY protein [Pirellulales bacterium]
MHEPIPERTEAVALAVIDAGMTVHRALGPGLLESVYEACLCHELSKRGVPFKRQVLLPVMYDGVRLDAGLRMDIWVEESVVVELKSVERMIPLYEAQLLSYLKLTGNRLGLLLNFNVPLLKDGIKRLVY